MRYDIAWQYRLSPDSYPEWGIVSEWDIDLELGGRWVVEAAVAQDLNVSEETRLLPGTRFHF